MLHPLNSLASKSLRFSHVIISLSTKIIANEATDRELISKIYKPLLQLNSRKINNPIKQWSQRTKQTFLQRRHTDGSQTHEKMLNITHYQRNTNQNHNEVPFHAGQNVCHQKVYKLNAGEGVEKKEPSYTVGGNAN